MTSLRFDEQAHERIERRRLEHEWRQSERRERFAEAFIAGLMLLGAALIALILILGFMS